MRKRVRTPKVVLTFKSTADAMAMEEAALAHNIPGRIIPVPSEIDAGCGSSWAVHADQEDELLSAVERYGLAYQAKNTVMMY